MAKDTLFVGLDVHAETISVAVAKAGRDGEVRSVGTIPNRPEAIRKLMRKLGPAKKLRVCYEAGPCGYVIYWQLAKMGIACEVIAPTLIPQKSGDRVKTDRRDAEKLARAHRAGDLTAVWIPDPQMEALRDLVRAREAAKKDELRARHRLLKFLLRHGRRPAERMTAWTDTHFRWLGSVKFEEPLLEVTFVDYRQEVDHAKERVERLDHYLDAAIELAPPRVREIVEALQAMRGVARTTAITVVTEVGTFTRFAKPQQAMAYAGIVPSEHSSGDTRRRGSITKTGNAHLRRVLVEAAWSYRHRPWVGPKLKARQKGLPEQIKEISWKAQHRLHQRFWRLASQGKPPTKAATAVARELVGFLWAIATEVERCHAAAENRQQAA